MPDAIAVSDNYVVDTELSPADITVSGNTITVTYNQVLSAFFVPSESSFEVMVDGAGRQVTGTAINGNDLEITFGGDVVTDTNQVEFGYTATGTNQVQDLYGGKAENLENVVIGNGNLTTLEGGNGADLIVGTSGDDVIAGNQGSDFLFGQAGADTFDFSNLPDGNGTDTILDFETGAGGDVIDIADVLVGYEAGVSDLADYVRAETYSDADDRVVLKISTQGVGNVNSDPFSPDLTIVLDNVFANGLDLNTFVDDLNTNGNIELG